MAFHARPNTHLFNQATTGYSTTNDNYELSDGSQLFLAVSVYADRAGNKFGKTLLSGAKR